ncbi:hypothetical protein cypCar_00022776 [Cyprinus carpio]|nr:hypothetical protein cypCar_00022776 [Cyprinus carpio]
MGIRHLLLLLVYLDPLCVLSTSTAKRSKPPQKRPPKVKEVNSTVAPTVAPRRITQVQAPIIGDHDTCLGYYDVSGQYDKEFACNNTDHRYCCGSCFLRFCCPVKAKRVDQRVCTNYNTPDWIKTQPPSPAPTGDTYDPALDQTNTTVYITCGVITLIIILGISAKVAYDKATRPPQEMNVQRALADILRQQGPIPISQYENENIAAIDTSPKENTPIRTSKNHYTPVHNKNNHGQHSIDDLGQLSWQELDVPLSYSMYRASDTTHTLLLLTVDVFRPSVRTLCVIAADFPRPHEQQANIFGINSAQMLSEHCVLTPNRLAFQRSVPWSGQIHLNVRRKQLPVTMSIRQRLQSD